MKSLMLLVAMIAFVSFPTMCAASEVPSTIQIEGKFYKKGLNGIYTECKECNQTSVASSPVCLPCQAANSVKSAVSSCGSKSSSAFQLGACGGGRSGPIRKLFSLFSCR